MTATPSTTPRDVSLRRRIRVLLVVFIVGLALSGVTAFPLETEMAFASRVLGVDPGVSPDTYVGMKFWVARVVQGLRDTNDRYPFIAYGTDWLAFGHLAIAVFFIGPLRDPVRNRWVIQAGMIICVGVIPLAFIAGHVRDIPLGWRLIDCSFGVLGIIPLWLADRDVRTLSAVAVADG